MKKITGFKWIIVALTLTFVISSLFAGCGQNTEGNKGNTTTESSSNASTSDTNVSGKVAASGSTALQPLVKQAADLFKAKYTSAEVLVNGGGSGKGLSEVSAGNVDIGNSDVYASEKLKDGKDKELVDHKVCVAGFAAIVNAKVKVDTLTKQQLKDIFTAKVTNWKDVGGDDMKIVIVNRAPGSGTRATFKTYALDGAEEASGQALTEDSSKTVVQTVAQTDGSISYLALSYLATPDSSIKALKLDGVEPTADNIKEGKYPIWSYEHMYTKGEAKGTTKAFLDYMASDEVKTLISKLGYIVTSDMKVTRPDK